MIIWLHSGNRKFAMCPPRKKLYTNIKLINHHLFRWMASGCTRVISIPLEGSQTPAGETQEGLSSLRGMGKWSWLGSWRWHAFTPQIYVWVMFWYMHILWCPHHMALEKEPSRPKKTVGFDEWNHPHVVLKSPTVFFGRLGSCDSVVIWTYMYSFDSLKLIVN